MTSIDYLMENDFILRFKFDPWSTPEVGVNTHAREVIDNYINDGHLISITEDGMVMAGWRLVNITHRGVCHMKVYDPDTLVFLNE